MCRPISMVMTKKSLFWLKNSDSHEDIIEHFGLQHLDRKKELVRLEALAPWDENGYPRYLASFKDWQVVYDCDGELPEWFSIEGMRQRVKVHLPEILKARVLRPKQKVNHLRSTSIVGAYSATISCPYFCDIRALTNTEICGASHCIILLQNKSILTSGSFVDLVCEDDCRALADCSFVKVSGLERGKFNNSTVNFMIFSKTNQVFLRNCNVKIDYRSEIKELHAFRSCITVGEFCTIDRMYLKECYLDLQDEVDMDEPILLDRETHIIGITID